MLAVNKQVDYALQLLLALSELAEKEYLSVGTFAEQRNISFLFLQKIVRKLKQAGFVASLKGSTGGYRLAVPAASITLKDIVEAVEGPYHVVSCLKQGTCPATAGCVSRDVFATVNKSILASLAQHSLDSISHTTHRV